MKKYSLLLTFLLGSIASLAQPLANCVGQRPENQKGQYCKKYEVNGIFDIGYRNADYVIYRPRHEEVLRPGEPFQIEWQNWNENTDMNQLKILVLLQDGSTEEICREFYDEDNGGVFKDPQNFFKITPGCNWIGGHINIRSYKRAGGSWESQCEGSTEFKVLPFIPVITPPTPAPYSFNCNEGIYTLHYPRRLFEAFSKKIRWYRSIDGTDYYEGDNYSTYLELGINNFYLSFFQETSCGVFESERTLVTATVTNTGAVDPPEAKQEVHCGSEGFYTFTVENPNNYLVKWYNSADGEPIPNENENSFTSYCELGTNTRYATFTSFSGACANFESVPAQMEKLVFDFDNNREEVPNDRVFIKKSSFAGDNCQGVSTDPAAKYVLSGFQEDPVDNNGNFAIVTSYYWDGDSYYDRNNPVSPDAIVCYTHLDYLPNKEYTYYYIQKIETYRNTSSGRELIETCENTIKSTTVKLLLSDVNCEPDFSNYPTCDNFKTCPGGEYTIGPGNQLIENLSQELRLRLLAGEFRWEPETGLNTPDDLNPTVKFEDMPTNLYEYQKYELRVINNGDETPVYCAVLYKCIDCEPKSQSLKQNHNSNKQPTIDSELNWEKQIKIFPNPVENYLLIENLPSTKLLTYRVLNLQGQIVQNGTASKSNDLSTIKKGIYLLQLIYEEKQISTHTFIKN